MPWEGYFSPPRGSEGIRTAPPHFHHNCYLYRRISGSSIIGGGCFLLSQTGVCLVRVSITTVTTARPRL